MVDINNDGVDELYTRCFTNGQLRGTFNQYLILVDKIDVEAGVIIQKYLHHSAYLT